MTDKTKSTGDNEVTKKPSLKQRLEDHLAEYGPIALVIYLSLSALTILGFYIAIKSGLRSGDSTSGDAGTLLAAWLAAKITLPLRIGATFLLTPIVVALLHKFRPKAQPQSTSDEIDSDETNSPKAASDKA